MLHPVSADELERVRRKVISGAALTDLELAFLEGAAARERTPALRLAVAHALMNAEQDRRALTFLRELERDRSADPEVQLALARAHLGLEDYAAAEAALKRALQLRPGDPEALKSLAALLLRHGELTKAKRLVADALERDPFDGEARALKEELEAVDPATFAEPQQTFSEAQFSTALLHGLREAEVPHLRRGSDLLLRLSGEELARLDLPSLYADVLGRGAPLADAVEELVKELRALQAQATQSPEEQLTTLLPVLRPGSFTQTAPDALHREGPGGLLIYYAFEDPELVRYVPAHGPLSLEAADRAAFENLEQRLAEPVPVAVAEGALRRGGADPELPLVALLTGDGHDAARLLLKAQREKLSESLGPAPWHVHLGRREWVVIARSAALLTTLGVAPDGIGGVYRLDPEGGLTPA